MGSILLTKEGMEIANVEQQKRDVVVNEFLSMCHEAESSHDRFFMTDRDRAHTYSFGLYYPAFVNLSWNEFKTIESLQGITFNTFNRMVNDFQCMSVCNVESEQSFEGETVLPQGHGGYQYTACSGDFICNLERLRKWHVNYLQNHPEDIVWDENNPFLPNVEAITRIINGEVYKYIQRTYHDEFVDGCDTQMIYRMKLNLLFADVSYYPDENANIKSNAMTLLFHRVVMPSMGRGDLQGYCIEVGSRICEENYYHYEQDLSTKEQRACGAQRHIFSIEKNHHKQYISFDFHKGMFEFHNEHGIHLGEYLFDGTLNAGAQTNHNFRTLS